MVEYLWDPMEAAGKAPKIRKNPVVWILIGGAKIVRKVRISP
jgi:hypothetical protein